jgi:hypothetical protein
MATFVYPLCFAIGALCAPGTVFCWLPILTDPGWTFTRPQPWTGSSRRPLILSGVNPYDDPPSHA